MQSCSTDEWTTIPVRLRANAGDPVRVWVDMLEDGRDYTFRLMTHYEDSTVTVGSLTVQVRTATATEPAATCVSRAVAFSLVWGMLDVIARCLYRCIQIARRGRENA